jgi:uncharacterized protein YbaR (Trm112 family)
MEHDDAEDRPTSAAVSRELLDLLVCPGCREALDDRGTLLRCRGCGLGFPVRDGIPVMLLDEALPPEEEPPGASREDASST